MSEHTYWMRRGSGANVVHIFRPMLDRPAVHISLCERHEFSGAPMLYVPWTRPVEPPEHLLCKKCMKAAYDD